MCHVTHFVFSYSQSLALSVPLVDRQPVAIVNKLNTTLITRVIELDSLQKKGNSRISYPVYQLKPNPG